MREGKIQLPFGVLLYCNFQISSRILFYFRSDRYLVSGNTNGFISFWDLTDDLLDGNETQSFHAHHDAVNGLRYVLDK